MVQYLEELLHSKTKDSQSAILFAQWSYDKRIIPAALQAVSNLFPHYSLHDESHSITIINNIVRVLGKDNFNRLSAIDLWLILEAAYWHDLGMVVSGEELVKAIQSPSFLQFLSDLISNPKHGLHEFAIKFEIVDGKLKARDSFYNLELNDSIRFILAEFFRWSHAERSSEIVSNPLDKIRIVSPRGVIPERIMKILGAICASHTKDFAEVMKLPFCEVGIDTEDAHPRFIACMLRIGDLLDLDNNRFSEVMLRTLTKIPIDTLNHKAKHLSIESFRVDRERIDIKANCEDYDTASIAQHWFNYLNDEVSAQMINWNRIVPSKELGYLPTIGSLRVELKSYDLIDGKHKPQFTVDTDKALALLQGAGLYEGAHQAFRELLQNAVDSSLIRMWLEHKEELDFSSPDSEEFKQAVKNYAISVSITTGEKEGDLRNWTIMLRDKGTGVSKSDLRFLMNTGSSFKNKTRTNIIKDMPLWMKPSGTFGIGFQSIFMLTDTVTIETKSFFDEQEQYIELNSPNSKKDGAILLKHIPSTHAVKPGLTLTLNYKIKAIPNRYSVNSNSRAGEIAHNFDPFTHESMDIEIGQIIDEVVESSYKSYFPIQLTMDDKPIEIKSDLRPFEFYDPINSMEMNIKRIPQNDQGQTKTFYKNQEAKNNLPSFEFLKFEVNIHKNVASDVLTLNRNEIKDSYRSVLYRDILDSSFRIITKNFHKFDDDAKVVASMFLDYYNEEASRPFQDVSSYNNWRDAEVYIEDRPMKLGELLNNINELELLYVEQKPDEVRKEEYILLDKILKIEFIGRGTSDYKSKFFINKVIKEFKGAKKGKSNEGFDLITLTKDNSDLPLLDFAGVIEILKNRNVLGSRFVIPCPYDFFDLRLKDGAFAPYVSRYRFDYNFKFNFPQMMSPFIIKTDRSERNQTYEKAVNDNLYDWVFTNRYNEQTSKEDIIEAYNRFCSEVSLDYINNKIV